MIKKLRNREPKKKTKIRYLEYIFFGSFFVGVLLANLYGKENLSQFGIFNTYYLQQFEYSKIDAADLFVYIIETRIPVLLVLAILGMTHYWLIIHMLFVAWNGAAIGFLFVSGISNLGLKAIPLVLVSLLPQYIFYVALYILLFELQRQLQNRNDYASGERNMGKMMMLLLGGIIIFLLLIGILTETYVNPFILKKILKIF